MTTQACLNGFEWVQKVIKLTYNSNVETDTGVDIPINCLVDPWSIALFVQTVDATETIDVGILSTESGGDANGFIAAASIATAGWVRPVLTATDASAQNYISANTLGALFFKGIDGANAAGQAGLSIIMPHLSDGVATSISYTCSTGSDTFVGFLFIRWMQLPNLTNFLT